MNSRGFTPPDEGALRKPPESYLCPKRAHNALVLGLAQHAAVPPPGIQPQGPSELPVGRMVMAIKDGEDFALLGLASGSREEAQAQ